MDNNETERQEVFTLEVKGIARRIISVRFTGEEPVLYVNDEPARRGAGAREFELLTDDGRRIKAEIVNPDPENLTVKIAGKTVCLTGGGSRPLAWYEWAVCGLPLLMVFAGGFIGAVIGSCAMGLNLKIVRSGRSRLVCIPAAIVLGFFFFGVYLVAAVWLQSLINKEKMKDTVREPEIELNVQVDNCTQRALELRVDNASDTLAIPAFSIAEIKVSNGQRRFQFLENGQEVEVVEAKILKKQVAVLNPLGRGRYRRLTATYSAADGGGGVDSIEETPGQRVLFSDYGLLHEFPSLIVMKKDPEQRTRLKQILPENLDNRLALDLLEAPAVPNNRSAYTPGQVTPERIRALGGEPLAPRFRDALLRFAEADNDALRSVALQALAPYEAEIPEAVATAWLAKCLMPVADSATPVPALTRADRELTAAGLRLLLGRGQLEPVLENFARLPADMLRDFFRQVQNMPIETQSSLATHMLRLQLPKESEAMLLNLLRTGKFEFDNGMFAGIAAHIDKLEADTSSSRGWLNLFAERLKPAVASLPAESAAAHMLLLLRNLRSPPEWLFQELLADDEHLENIARHWEDLAELPRRQLLRQLDRNLDVHGVTQPRLELAWLALADNNQTQRSAAAGILNKHAIRDFTELHRALETVAAGTDIPEEKKLRQERLLADLRNIHERLDAVGLVKLLTLIEHKWTVTQAARRLINDDSTRAANLRLLSRAAAASSPAVRARLISLVDEFGHAGRWEGEAAAAVRELTALGLRDADPAVHAATAAACLAISDAAWSPPEKVVAMLRSLPPELQDPRKLQIAFNWQIRSITENARSPEERLRATQQLLAAARNAPDATLALAAIKNIPAYDEPCRLLKTEALTGMLAVIKDPAIAQNIVGEISGVSENTPQKTVQTMLSAYDRFPGCREDVIRRLDAVPLATTRNVFTQALRDTDAKVRVVAFRSLYRQIHRSQHAGIKNELAQLLQKTAAAEADASTRRTMESMLRPLQNK